MHCKAHSLFRVIIGQDARPVNGMRIHDSEDRKENYGNSRTAAKP